MRFGALGAQVAHPDRHGRDIVWAQFFRHVRSHLVGTGLLCAVGGSLVKRHRTVVDVEPAVLTGGVFEEAATAVSPA